MGPDQNHVHAFDSAEAKERPKVRSKHGLIGQVAKLIGKTVGLAQSTGAKTAEGVFAAGRQAGQLLHVPSNLRSLVAYDKEQQRKAEAEIERLSRRIERLYTRIGERICHSPLFDRSLLPMDPQLEAFVATVRELELEAHNLHDQADAEESRRPRHGLLASAAKREPSYTRSPRVSESQTSMPSPAPAEGGAQHSGAE